MANRALAAKRERAARQIREAAAQEGYKHFILAVDRGEVGKAVAPACDGAMVQRCDPGEARGLQMDVGRMGKARAARSTKTYGNDRRVSIDLMDCVGRLPVWRIVPGPRGR